MSWATAHQEAMILAAETRERLGLDGFERLDVFDAVVADGLKLMFRPLQHVAGFYEPARAGAGPGVLINGGHPLSLQRYSAGHEYGHHLFGHGRQVDRDGEPRPGRPTATPDEQRAEAFSAWFLMPPEGAQTVLDRLGIPRPATEQEAYTLALRLGVSYRAMCIHLPSLGLVHRATAEAWARLALKSVKRQLTHDPPSGGWANDVWVVREPDAQAPLVVRCGDRLLFDLPGARASRTTDGLAVVEISPSDLLSTSRLCVDLPVDLTPGPAEVVLDLDGQEVAFALVAERPRRGRYFLRTVVAR